MLCKVPSLVPSGHSQHKDKVQGQRTEGASQCNEVTEERKKSSHKGGEHHVEDSGDEALCDVEEGPGALVFAPPGCVHCLIDRTGIDLQQTRKHVNYSMYTLSGHGGECVWPKQYH